jgi:CRP/FNR family transcriptional regulator
MRRLSVDELIKSSPYFTGLEDSFVDYVSRLMVERMVEKHEVIWLEQDPAKMVYFVASGLIKLLKISTEGKEQIIKLVRPGESFGHNGILNGSYSVETAQAAVPSILYGLSKSNLDNLLHDNNRLALNTIRILATEAHHYISLIEDLSLRRVSGRLARLLLDYNSDSVFDESPILTRGDMASMIGTAREVLGKSLKVLEEEGIIKTAKGGQIVIVEKEMLTMIADTK